MSEVRKSGECVINRPVEDVFRTYIDFERWGDWSPNPAGTTFKLLTPPPVRLGTEYEVAYPVSILGFKTRMKTLERITEYEENRRVVYVNQNGPTTNHIATFEAVEGGTRFGFETVTIIPAPLVPMLRVMGAIIKVDFMNFATDVAKAFKPYAEK